ncbi:MAG TPA: gamma-glutamyltransferase [Gemmatimonadaceae bacterium]|nr:gamma-glutamyltransferase [Gemmatimonadaceae bacterium]
MRLIRRAMLLSTLIACHRTGAPSPASAPAVSGRRATDAGLPTRQAAGAAVYTGDRRPPTFPGAWPYKAGRAAVFGAHAMVASDASLASQAGVEILKEGGNAVDAAVAVGFALAVVYPEAGNIGGGGYMVIHLADGRSATLDYREVAPLGATRDMYLDAQGALTGRSIIGPLASGVPGAVAGLTAALVKYGTMPLEAVMAPAIRFAEQGFVVDSALALSIARDAKLIGQFKGGELLLPDGRPLTAGTVLRQPALARTLRRIAERGAEGFYKGETARMLADEMRHSGGIITQEDLARYQPVWREPVRSTYRGYTLLTMPPSSSGGVTVTETLNILEGLDVAPFGSTRWAHLLGSAYQRAFVDRNEKLADPAFHAVPMAQLTDKAYAAKLRATIAPDRATPTPSVTQAMREGMETTHYSVADAQGNAVATTTTLNALYGSGVYVAAAGFFLNDQMDDFAARPGYPNAYGLVQGEANAIQAGKRMLSAMSPTIVLDRDGMLLLVVGSRGGPRIITSTSQVILDVLDHHMILSDAVSAPRIHHQALPDTLRFERDGLEPAVVDSLRAMGYSIAPYSGVGLINAIMKVKAGYEGMSDPRSSGVPVGY